MSHSALHTTVCDLLGCSYPVLQAGMCTGTSPPSCCFPKWRVR
jgi:hypothetical protein